MLVLTRKVDEQILIGDDIKITLIRVRGNSVRIGIEAPRSVRVVRGELDKKHAVDTAPIKQEIEVSLSGIGENGAAEVNDLAEVFAHPESVRLGASTRKNMQTEMFVGKVRSDGSAPTLARVSGDVKSTRAPLAGFVSAN